MVMDGMKRIRQPRLDQVLLISTLGGVHCRHALERLLFFSISFPGQLVEYTQRHRPSLLFRSFPPLFHPGIVIRLSSVFTLNLINNPSKFLLIRLILRLLLP
jgi:hypothetical protein